MPDPAQGRRALGTGPRKEAGRHTGAGPAAVAQKEVKTLADGGVARAGTMQQPGRKSDGGRSAADPCTSTKYCK